jgi:hypothetical protein
MPPFGMMPPPGFVPPGAGMPPPFAVPMQGMAPPPGFGVPPYGAPAGNCTILVNIETKYINYSIFSNQVFTPLDYPCKGWRRGIIKKNVNPGSLLHNICYLVWKVRHGQSTKHQMEGLITTIT